MKVTVEHLRKKKRNLVLTIILFILQITIIGFSIYFLYGNTSIYEDIGYVCFMLGVPSILLLSLNILFLFRGEWISRFAISRIRFDQNPLDFLKYTFPFIGIAFLFVQLLFIVYFLV